jgi:predicted ATPase/transcriptional regulator with GAF, ATPase, and Fis domain
MSMPAGYDIIAQIYQGRRSAIFRALRSRDQHPVILKTLRTAFPTAEHLTRLRQEFALGSVLADPHIIRYHAFEDSPDGPFLVEEDCDGVALVHLMPEEGFALTTFLPLAIQLAQGLEAMQRAGILHHNINPSNIVLNAETLTAKFIDFSSASHLTREPQQVRNLHRLAGTLVYMAPEQTGRMNQQVDCRTDMYALGVTFYQMLTGAVPFRSDNALEIVHAHLAVMPTAIEATHPHVPRLVSAIIAKLLAKHPEERYQSAYGLRQDLEACHTQWMESGVVDAFPLARHDRPAEWHLSHKLYGREHEVHTLLEVYERVALGHTELLLVTGYSGIGKTSLVRELQTPVLRHQGYYISGKFEPDERNVPYSAMLQAFRQLLTQLLTESHAAIAAWRERLLHALQPNAQVLIEVLPELALIIGHHAPAPALDAPATHNRFTFVVQNFVRVFARKTHPLVLFLDDLQWAGGSSLTLLEALVAGCGDHSLLVIGAYRDNEVGPHHPLWGTLENIRKTDVLIQSLTLMPLALESVTALIADSLHCPPQRVTPLAALVHAKTQGNPFFVKAFLTALYDEKLVYIGADAEWTWTLDPIRQRQETENVADLLSKSIRGLAQPVQKVLTLAACIGYRFDLADLVSLSGRAEEDLVALLAECQQHGLIAKGDDEYQFAHDRIHAAAYALVDEADRKTFHLQLGQALLQKTPEAGRAQQLFTIVNHLNSGAEFLTRQADRDELARLNVLAGHQARAAAAYPTALQYYQTGFQVLDHPTSWQRHYALTLDLATGAAETAFLSTDFSTMERWITAVLQGARTLLDKIPVYRVHIQACLAQNQLTASLEMAFRVLQHLGIDVAALEDPSHLPAVMHETHMALAGKSLQELLELPEMTDPSQRAAIHMLSHLLSPSYITAPKVFGMIVCTMMQLSIAGGYNPFTAYAYALYGQLLCGRTRDIAAAGQFGHLALKLLEREPAGDMTPKVYVMVYGCILPWTEALTHTLQPLLVAYQGGLEHGDFESARVAVFFYCIHRYFLGTELPTVEREIAMYRQAISQLQPGPSQAYMVIWHQVVLNLLGHAAEPWRLVGTVCDEATLLPHLLEVQHFSAVLQLHCAAMILGYLWEENNRALTHTARAGQLIERATGWTLSAVFYFYDSLVRLRACAHQPPSEREHLLQQVAANQEQLAVRAQHAPMNHRHKWCLVKAERARVLEREGEARVAYDHAIDLAQQHGYIQEAALANELAGRFYLTLGQEAVAKLYLQAAYRGYLQWGAAGKVKQMETRYAAYVAPGASGSTPLDAPRNGSTEGTAITASSLDLATTLKAAQALSSAITLDRLLETMVSIVIENAGAQRGVFLWEQDDQLLIVARSDVEQQGATMLAPMPLESCEEVSRGIIHYVQRTREAIIIDDAGSDEQFTADPYLIRQQPKSIGCIPISNQTHLLGILYLENNLTTHAFTPQRLELLQVLAAQMAISLENARVHAALQQEIADHKQAGQALHKALTEVAQLQERLQAENSYLREEIRHDANFEEIVGRSPVLMQVLHQVERVAVTDTTVLILGETGTGKELIARAIHNHSMRKDRPLVKVNCAALPPTLIESELFGHEKGAFTGAFTRKVGRFELADAGTIFLDEIGDLPLDLQAKLLRVLQEGEFERLGAVQTTRVDVRVIAATNRNLVQHVATGNFRDDLYYRLNVFPVTLPPLRERREDISLLVWYFISKYQDKLGKTIERIPERAMTALLTYHWPGNIRELANVIERALILSPGSTLIVDETLSSRESLSQNLPTAQHLEEVERAHILAVLEACQWRIKGAGQAAERLGLHPSTLYSRMKKLGLERQP